MKQKDLISGYSYGFFQKLISLMNILMIIKSYYKWEIDKEIMKIGLVTDHGKENGIEADKTRMIEMTEMIETRVEDSGRDSKIGHIIITKII